MAKLRSRARREIGHAHGAGNSQQLEATVETVLLQGEAGQALLKYARAADVDLIRLGGHEQGLMDRILLGSIRTRVVRAATCSVLIAPPRAS